MYAVGTAAAVVLIDASVEVVSISWGDGMAKAPAKRAAMIMEKRMVMVMVLDGCCGKGRWER